MSCLHRAWLRGWQERGNEALAYMRWLTFALHPAIWSLNCCWLWSGISAFEFIQVKIAISPLPATHSGYIISFNHSSWKYAISTIPWRRDNLTASQWFRKPGTWSFSIRNSGGIRRVYLRKTGNWMKIGVDGFGGGRRRPDLSVMRYWVQPSWLKHRAWCHIFIYFESRYPIDRAVTATGILML